MEQEKTHRNYKLWDYVDNQITTNRIDVAWYFASDQYGTSDVRIQINIVNRKNKIFTNFTMNHACVTNYVAQFSEIYQKITEYKKKIESENSNISFRVADFRKIVTTFLSRTEYGGMCVRMAIGEKDKDIIDTDTIYIPYMDYVSLIKVLTGFRDSYIQLCSNVPLIIAMETLNSGIIRIDNKLTDYYIKSKNDKPAIPEGISNLSGNNDFDVIQGASSSTSIIESPADVPAELLHLNNDLNKYLAENRDTFDLGVENTVIQCDDSKASLLQNDFVKNFLKDDVSNLEMYLLNCLNEVTPFSKLCDLIGSKVGKDFLKVDQNQFNAINYTSTVILKYYLNQHLSEKVQLPSSLPLVVFSEPVVSELSLSVMYDLYICLLYFSQLKNQLKEKDHNTTNNRELICFIMKIIVSPLIFTYIKNITKDVLVNEVLIRYNQYRNDKVFDILEEKIHSSFGIHPSIDSNIIKSEVSRTYDIIINNPDKLTIDQMFNSCSSMKLCSFDYETIKKYNLSQEQMYKIIALDLNYRKNNKVEVKELNNWGIKEFSDLPDEILTKYGLKENPFDNTNLLRFIDQTCKDDKNLDIYRRIAKLINKSYYDLKGKGVDFAILPEQVLKAIWVWDCEKDKKISNNYNYYTEQIANSSLDKSMILSMLVNLSDRKDSDFVESLKATTMGY